ncbi:MAG TPA: hypothetical protein DEO59_11815 [Balneola sp.]|jgi:hypothetical protein|nr:hypothetical protein [Balneola sp.]MAO78766.1 hypothetical protein [Balneola sp.]MBF64719.1 hypothetical protein [Balneola sp.]HBZ39117.1 hypothetical protein [Balneola sp.]|tara:strand:- start:6869 stop:8380 length:1512 start_codon:yes stop_codon:yes gene_type:complete
MTKGIILLSIVLLCISGCKYEPPASASSLTEESIALDFSRTFAVGGTYSSGFMDGALFTDGQKYSYPNLFAQSLSEIYERDIFIQADIESENGFNLEEGDNTKGKYKLVYESLSSMYVKRIPESGQQIGNWSGDDTDLNDYSFPGLKVHELLNSNGDTNNPYYNRVEGLNGSIIDQIVDKNPTMVILSLGNEDVLSFAFNGASGSDQPNLNTITEIDLIKPEDFQNIAVSIVNKIINETDAEIFIANVINPIETPFFNEIDWALELQEYDTSYIAAAGRFYEELNEQIAKHNFVENGSLPLSERRSIINFQLDAYCEVPTLICEIPFFIDRVNRARVIEDEYLDSDTLSDGTILPKIRQLTEGEKILYDNLPNLHRESLLSGIQPLNDSQVLTHDEIVVIENRIQSYNQILDGIAGSSNRIYLLDFHSVIEKLQANELNDDGVFYTNQFDELSFYSSDGYTINRRGQAFLANTLIEKLNEISESNVPKLKPNLFEGNKIEIGL